MGPAMSLVLSNGNIPALRWQTLDFNTCLKARSAVQPLPFHDPVQCWGGASNDGEYTVHLVTLALGTFLECVAGQYTGLLTTQIADQSRHCEVGGKGEKIPASQS